MRIYIWHGYLLRGTGSNEYTAALARTLARQGHDVTVFCAEDGVGVDLGGAAVVRNPLPGRLPVFVLDHYEGMTAVRLPDMPEDEAAEFVEAQAAAIRGAGPADLLITNHALLGGPVGAASGLPFVVKVHGSELEYAMRGNQRLITWAHETLESAEAIVAGSEHVHDVVVDLIGFAPTRIEVIPPGVDIEEMRPRPRAEALGDLIAEAELDPPNDGDERLPDEGNAEAFAQFLADDVPLVTYVGKLSEQKGVWLLLEALADLPAKAVIVGFGPARATLEEQADRLGLRVLFTGPLQHRHLSKLWPLATASVVPSVFPEAFGMVAAEAAACGCPPVVSRHSGLAEIAEGLEAHLPEQLRLVSYPLDEPWQLRERLEQILALDAADRAELSAGCRQTVVDLWSWDSVARRIVAAGLPAGG